MNSRGQAALEYLMTYGWALVIIVVVAGILFFIMSSPAGNVVCNSSDPAKIPVQAANIPKSGTLSVKLINGTAGNIASISLGAGGTSNTFDTVATVPSGLNSLNSGAVLELRPTFKSGYTPGNALDSNTSITMQYTDQFAYVKVMKVTCQGSPGPAT